MVKKLMEIFLLDKIVVFAEDNTYQYNRYEDIDATEENHQRIMRMSWMIRQAME